MDGSWQDGGDSDLPTRQRETVRTTF